MQQALHVKNYLNPKFITIKPDQFIKDVIFVFNKQKIFAAPVLDDLGNLVGVLSGSDCIRASIEGNFDLNSHLTVSLKTVSLFLNLHRLTLNLRTLNIFHRSKTLTL